MSKDIFSGLEDLGFNNIDEIELFAKKDEAKKDSPEKKIESEITSIYDTEVTCPVCDSKFKAKTVKASAPRPTKKDSDSFQRYATINPYFYDILLCNCCGYAAMRSDFHKIRNFQIDAVRQKLSIKWVGKNYPNIYDANIAIERYKLALLNAVVMEAKSSKKAMLCLRIAWMYRLINANDNELMFLKQALEGFTDAYSNEDGDIYGMDRFTIMYMLGELSRRVGKEDEALTWFSKVITTPTAPQKLKERSRDQKDLIKPEHNNEENAVEINDHTEKKHGFFSKLFK